jgi:aryl-alcohol dehydrogenase-like predicted oxidoreductase
MLRRAIEDHTLSFVAGCGIGVLAYSPMGAGMLTGAMTRERIADMPADDWRQRNVEFQEPRLSRNLALVERLREIGSPHGRTPGEVAIAWVLRRPEVTAAIVGMRSPAQVEGVIGAGAFRLSDDEIRQIEAQLQTPAS